jgi:hypothetical protein
MRRLSAVLSAVRRPANLPPLRLMKAPALIARLVGDAADLFVPAAAAGMSPYGSAASVRLRMLLTRSHEGLSAVAKRRDNR